nr:hypothetical protein [Tanacetum cinerariifolium]
MFDNAIQCWKLYKHDTYLYTPNTLLSSLLKHTIFSSAATTSSSATTLSSATTIRQNHCVCWFQLYVVLVVDMVVFMVDRVVLIDVSPQMRFWCIWMLLGFTTNTFLYRKKKYRLWMATVIHNNNIFYKNSSKL